MNPPVQKSLFEDDFLVRTLGEIAYRPETAISELVANAWDAGAATVRVSIPVENGGKISVEDDGVGLNEELFRSRWMRLGYQRRQHQGEWAEFPRIRSNEKRKAYGRNGQGRHAMLCFADQYCVDTLRDTEVQAFRFTVQPSSNDSPFVLTETVPIAQTSHGTCVWTTVEKNLPSAAQIVDAMSLAFLFDPKFTIVVNGERIGFESFESADKEIVKFPGGRCTVTFLKLPDGKKGRTGVAFWVGNRLVGQPSYQILGTALIDGRSTAAKNHFVLVQSDDLFDHVQHDWSGFKRTDEFLDVASHVAAHVGKVAAKLNSDAIEDTKKAAYIENRDGIRTLTPLGKEEVRDFVERFVERIPAINADVLSAGIAAAINLEQSRSGHMLLGQLATIESADVDALSRMLNDWTIKDAMVVLDEISRRSATVEAIRKLKGDPSADELHTMHPLVAQARWLFGPEFDSPCFLSNSTIRAAAESVFKKKIDASQIGNPRQRPDLIFIREATLGITGIDRIDADSEVAVLDRLLLLELKRGDAMIVLKHIHQAQEYIQDLLSCGLLDGSPHIRAFVVGHRIDTKLTNVTKIGEPEVARIQAITFDQLVRTAEMRLFGLSQTLQSHFKNTPAAVLLDSILGTTAPSLFPDETPVHTVGGVRPRSRKR